MGNSMKRYLLEMLARGHITVTRGSVHAAKTRKSDQ
jgi:hypothetical protein